MIRRPPRSTRTAPLVPYTTLFRSEPDGKVFTDFHTPESTTAPERTPEPVRHELSAHAAQPSVSVKAGSLTGEGFPPGEEVVVAIVVHRAPSNADGTLDLHLPVAPLDRTASDVVLVGEQSGATSPQSATTDTQAQTRTAACRERVGK